jgi:hypothetical protein
MRKTIVIDGKECEFKSSAAIPRMYRLKFNRDIFVDLAKLDAEVKYAEKVKNETGESVLQISSLEVFENVAFLMHKHGDPSQPKEIEDWLEQFEMFDIYDVLPQIMEMWKIENEQKSIPKKRVEK